MRFYVLEAEGGTFGTKWAYGDILDPHDTRNIGPRCPECSNTVRSLVWLPPHRIKLSSAKPDKWGDFLWGAFWPLMVSDRLWQVYQSEGLKGIVKVWPPADIVRMGTKKTGDLTPTPPTYHLVDLLWNGANLDDVASELTRKDVKCAYCRRSHIERYRGLVMETSSWTGADLFVARGLPGVVLASERFAEVAQKHGLKNVKLIPAEKYAYDESRTRYASPWYVKE